MVFFLIFFPEKSTSCFFLLNLGEFLCKKKIQCFFFTADQVQGVMEEDSSVKDFQVEKKLLSWCQTSLDG